MFYRKNRRRGLHNKSHEPVRTHSQKMVDVVSPQLKKALATSLIEWFDKPVASTWGSGSFEVFWAGRLQDDRQLLLIVKGTSMSRSYSLYVGSESDIASIVQFASKRDKHNTTTSDVEHVSLRKEFSCSNLKELQALLDIYSSSESKDLLTYLLDQSSKIRRAAKIRYHQIASVV